MTKILFLINTLGGGGAEKVLVNLVNNMDSSAFDITVETMFDDGVNADRLNKNIRYISKKAHCPRGIAYILRFFSAKQLYRYFIGNEKYDVIVAYMHGAPVKVISGCPDSKTKKIAWLHNGNPETGTFFRFWFSKKKAFDAYRSCNSIAAVSDSVAKAFSKYTVIKDNVSVVYNTNEVAKIRSMATEFNPYENAEESFRIVSVGRISAEKGYDRFYHVCHRLHDEGYNFDVTIAGSGEKENELRQLVEKDNSCDWFHFAGFQSNPYPYVANADLFVCPSYQEGLSTAVTEAVILGVPCISTDVSGAKEILGYNNEYGVVTQNNEDALYIGIKELLENKEFLKKYQSNVQERASFFDTAKTVKQAEDLFLNT